MLNGVQRQRWRSLIGNGEAEIPRDPPQFNRYPWETYATKYKLF